jgi:hypothetical protein
MLKKIEDMNYYELLEVSYRATAQEIHKAYERVRKIYDPNSIALYSLFSPDETEKIRQRVAETYPDGYRLIFHVSGRDGVMGRLEQVKEIRSHELCLLIEVTAPSQDIASSIAGIVRHQGLHLPIPEWSGLITALACPYNPAHLDRGAVYRFNVNHVVEPDDPFEMFPMELVEIDGAALKRRAS